MLTGTVIELEATPCGLARLETEARAHRDLSVRRATSRCPSNPSLRRHPDNRNLLCRAGESGLRIRSLCLPRVTDSYRFPLRDETQAI